MIAMLPVRRRHAGGVQSRRVRDKTRQPLPAAVAPPPPPRVATAPFVPRVATAAARPARQKLARENADDDDDETARRRPNEHERGVASRYSATATTTTTTAMMMRKTPHYASDSPSQRVRLHRRRPLEMSALR